MPTWTCEDGSKRSYMRQWQKWGSALSHLFLRINPNTNYIGNILFIHVTTITMIHYRMVKRKLHHISSVQQGLSSSIGSRLEVYHVGTLTNLCTKTKCQPIDYLDLSKSVPSPWRCYPQAPLEHNHRIKGARYILLNSIPRIHI
jgi:hypothetical protein